MILISFKDEDVIKPTFRNMVQEVVEVSCLLVLSDSNN